MVPAVLAASDSTARGLGMSSSRGDGSGRWGRGGPCAVAARLTLRTRRREKTPHFETLVAAFMVGLLSLGLGARTHRAKRNGLGKNGRSLAHEATPPRPPGVN